MLKSHGSKVDFSPDAKLPWVDKLTYSAAAGFSTNVSWVVFGYYLMFFYTDVFGISATVAGSIMMFARLFDAVTDVFMGWAVDRFCFKWGKYRSWIVIAIIPITLLFIGVFTAIPTDNRNVLVAWAAVTYGCFGSVAATLVYIPLSAQMVNMTKNVKERASIGGLKAVFNNISNIAVASCYLPMVNFFGGAEKDMAQGFLITTIIFAAVVFFMLLGNIIVTKKYEFNEDGSHRAHLLETTHEPVLAQIKDVFSNRPAVVMTCGIFVQYTLQAIRSGFTVYIFTYYLLTPDFMSFAMFIFMAMAAVGALLMRPIISAVKDSNRAFLLIMIVSAIANFALFFAMKGMGQAEAAASMQYGLIFFLFIFNGLCQGAHFGFNNVIVPSTIEYGAWKTGKRQPGLVYALLAICLTVGGAVGGQITGILLDSSGYVPNAVQSAATLDGLLFAAFLLPAILTIVQIVIQSFFGLNDKKYAECVNELNAREMNAE